MQDKPSDIIGQAAALLVAKGYAREWAEELLRLQSYSPHPDNADEWVEQILSAEAGNGGNAAAARRRHFLDEHHRKGIPPFDPLDRDLGASSKSEGNTHGQS
jgi:hypothetical protein